MGALGAILVAAGAFRIAYFLQYRAESVYFDVPFLDAFVYDGWARAIANGTYAATTPFYFAPGYPYALAFLYRFVPSTPAAVYAVQLALGVTDVALVHYLGRAAFGRRAGALAALLAVLYAPLPFFETKILSASLALTLLLLSLAALVAAAARGRWARWGLSGILLGATALVRPETLLMGPLLAVWIVCQGCPPRTRGWRATLGVGVLVAAGAALAIAPAAVHNLRTGGGTTLISSQGGLAFYQSNNPRARGFYVFLLDEGFSGSPAGQEQEEQAIAERALGRQLTRSEVSSYWFHRGLAFIAAQPARFLWLLGMKFLRFIGSYEYSTEFSLYVERERVWLLWLPCAPFALVMALAVPTLVRRPPTAAAGLLLAAFAANLGAVLVFYMSSRYRLASVPPLLAFAGATLDRLAASFRTDRRGAALTAAMVAACFTVAHRQWDDTAVHQEAAAHFNAGLAWAGRKSDHARAVAEYRRALETAPERYDCWYYLGGSLRALGSSADAARAYGEAARLRPQLVEAHIGRGQALEEAGNRDGARAAYETARLLRPGDPAIEEALARLSRQPAP